MTRIRRKSKPTGAPRGRRPLPDDEVRSRVQIWLTKDELVALRKVGGSSPSVCVQILIKEWKENRI